MDYNSSEIWAIVKSVKNQLKVDSLNGTIAPGLFSAIDNVKDYSYKSESVTPLEIMFDAFLQKYTDYIVLSADSSELSNIYSVSSETDQLALTIKKGDICVRTDISASYVASGTTNDAMTNWVQLLFSASSVVSSSSSITDHNLLDGLEGLGTNYYHLSIDEYNQIHTSASINGPPLTILGQEITFNYDINTLDLIGNQLTVKDGVFLSAISAFIPIGSTWRLRETSASELWLEKTYDGGNTWSRKQRWA
jgi:hypothetical protein